MIYATPESTSVGFKQSLNKSAIENNCNKPIIHIHNRQQKSVNIDNTITKNGANISFTSNISLVEEPIVIPKRPKSSQGGSTNATLKAKMAKAKILSGTKEGKKYKRKHTSSHTDNVIFLKNEMAELEELNSSYHKYNRSVGMANPTFPRKEKESVKGIGGDLFAKSAAVYSGKGAQMPLKNAAFSKPIVKKGDDIFSRIVVENYANKKETKDLQRPFAEV